MKLLKKFASFSAALLVSISSLFILAVPHAFAISKTWTGGGGDTNMDTAGNWTGGAPSAGDDLIFPANITNKTVVNNYTAGTSFNSITFSGTATQASNYALSGNALTVVAGVTNSMTGSFSTGAIVTAPITLGGAQTINAGTTYISFDDLNVGTFATVSNGDVYINGTLTGSGNITVTGTTSTTLGLAGNNSTYSGSLIVSSGNLEADTITSLGSTSSGTTVASGGRLTFCNMTSDKTTAEPISLAGNGTNVTIGVYQATCHSGGGVPTTNFKLTLTGAVTLTANTIFEGYHADLKIDGTYTANSHTFTVAPGGTGNLTLPSGTIASEPKTTTYAANDPSTSINVAINNIAIVNGTYDIGFIDGGTLKGTGTLTGGISLTLAPGLSPGCLVSGAGLTLSGGTYQVELGGTTACTEYDQLTVTGTVALGSATTLTPSLYGDFKPAAGNTFTIISNDAADAVTGTFTGLAEGATFTVDGYVYKISYIGGDGNDVVLTVVTVPSVADTGFKLITSSAGLIVAGTLALTASSYYLSRRYVTAKTK